MEQQAAMVTRLKKLEREILELPPPTGETFGPIDTTRSRAILRHREQQRRSGHRPCT
uniref:Uncharacterized protein n=1 Tax=Hyaloperonospora arabidopsidis (strain Emoy2) TaxID=559515 RepID=M4BED3_HYAAE